MKIFKFLKNINVAQNVQGRTYPEMSDEDIDLLAVMCEMCRPSVHKTFFEYAYYVPVSDAELVLAKNIFKKNGIIMHDHVSNITFCDERNVLRVRYILPSDRERIFKIMDKIKQKHIKLYLEGRLSERQAIWQKVSELKQNKR